MEHTETNARWKIISKTNGVVKGRRKRMRDGGGLIPTKSTSVFGCETGEKGMVFCKWMRLYNVLVRSSSKFDTLRYSKENERCRDQHTHTHRDSARRRET